jgi:predicted dithiol-disulfide oxidoreductase (DUF899 family)
MALPEVVSGEEWLVARKELLAKEKELTRRRDALNAERRRLPMVEVTKTYTFDQPGGPVTLAELFGDRLQLIVQHIMFGPGWDAACPVCTTFMNELSQPVLDRLADRQTAYVLVSRAPLAKLQAYQAQMGWSLPWYSSYRSDFNYDFQVTVDPSAGQPTHNYRPAPDLPDGQRSTEKDGVSCFLRDGGRVFHTYSAYARGLDHTDLPYAYLDLTALGRQESWEEPRDRAPILRWLAAHLGDALGHGAGGADRHAGPAKLPGHDGPAVTYALVLRVGRDARALAGTPVPGDCSPRRFHRRPNGRIKLVQGLGGRRRNLLAPLVQRVGRGVPRLGELPLRVVCVIRHDASFALDARRDQGSPGGVPGPQFLGLLHG